MPVVASADLAVEPVAFEDSRRKSADSSDVAAVRLPLLTTWFTLLGAEHVPVSRTIETPQGIARTRPTTENDVFVTGGINDIGNAFDRDDWVGAGRGRDVD